MDFVETRPVTKYVSQLLLWLSKRGPMEVTFTKSQGFPVAPVADLADADLYRRVTNRLKLMTRITPMQYPAPVTGEFIFAVGQQGYVAKVEIHDEAPDPWFHIRCKSTGAYVDGTNPKNVPFDSVP